MKKKMSLAQKINVLRASVMGANDGIISVAGIVIGVAAATSNPHAILISGLSGSLAGTISMCMGEYVSVSTEKDSQKMALIEEKERLSEDYDREFNYVKNKFLAQDIDPKLAHQATKELMDEDPAGYDRSRALWLQSQGIYQSLCSSNCFIDRVSSGLDFADGCCDELSA